VIEYFRLFKKLNNRERNFGLAFGEPFSAFEGKLNSHLRGWSGNDRNAPMAEQSIKIEWTQGLSTFCRHPCVLKDTGSSLLERLLRLAL
jgi:hypothetical protein